MASNLLLSLAPGKVKNIPLGSVVGVGLIKLEPMVSALTVIITSFKLDHSVNVQFQKTLQKAVYAYTFGDMLGDLTVSGVAVNSECVGGTAQRGVDRLMEFYYRNKMSTSLKPIKISFGGKVTEGYLIGMEIGSDDADSYVCRFNLSLKLAAPEA